MRLLKPFYTPPVLKQRRFLIAALAAGVLLGSPVAKADGVPPLPMGGLPPLEGGYLPEPLFLNQDRVLRDYSPFTGDSTLMPSPTPMPSPWWLPTPAMPGMGQEKIPPFQVFYNQRSFEPKIPVLMKDGAFYMAATDITQMLGLIMQPYGAGVQYFIDGYYLRFKPETKEFEYQSILDPGQTGAVFITRRPIIRDGRLMLPLKDIAPYMGLSLNYDTARRHLNVEPGTVISRFSPGPRFQGQMPY